jgi:hypothetical protein
MATRLAVRGPGQGMKHAQSLVRQVCRIAGQPTWVDEVQSDAIGTGLVGAVADHNTAVIFDWLIREISHQGISDLSIGFQGPFRSLCLCRAKSRFPRAEICVGGDSVRMLGQWDGKPSISRCITVLA